MYIDMSIHVHEQCTQCTQYNYMYTVVRIVPMTNLKPELRTTTMGKDGLHVHVLYVDTERT